MHRTSIDLFVWEAPGKLLFVDSTGEWKELEMEKPLVEAALKLFDGELKSVERSSGGLSLVQPERLILYPNGDEGPEIRVRVQVRDLHYDKTGKILSPRICNLTKDVPFWEIKDAFALNLQGAQSFVMNFGYGLVPIYVVHFEQSTPEEPAGAYFITRRDADQVIKASKDEKVAVQNYYLPDQLALRALPDTILPTPREETSIPAAFRFGEPIAVPGSGNYVDARHFLRLQILRKLGVEAARPNYLSLQQDSAEFLPLRVLNANGR